MYHVIDTRTGWVVRVCKTFRGAHRAADRLDAIYGGVRFGVQRASTTDEA